MRLQTNGALPAGSADAGLARQAILRTSLLAEVFGFIEKSLVIAELEARKLRHDFTDLITRAAQPVIWLLLFGEVFSRARAIPTGEVRYLDFITPGILAQSSMFISIFYGIAIIWERDMGIVHKFLASPTPRAALVMGKALSAGIRALSQAVIVIAVALLLSVKLNTRPLALIGALVIVLLGSALFSIFSLIVACLVKVRERFMGIGQILSMPLFFTSNALYPISMMPDWLRVISRLNPMTYEVDALRTLMLSGQTSGFGLAVDFAVLLTTTVVMVIIGARVYPRIVI
jgi:ABC-2 type transport system permease protein